MYEPLSVTRARPCTMCEAESASQSTLAEIPTSRRRSTLNGRGLRGHWMLRRAPRGPLVCTQLCSCIIHPFSPPRTKTISTSIGRSSRGGASWRSRVSTASGTYCAATRTRRVRSRRQTASRSARRPAQHVLLITTVVAGLWFTYRRLRSMSSTLSSLAAEARDVKVRRS